MIKFFNGIAVSLAALVALYVVMSYVPFETQAQSVTDTVTLEVGVSTYITIAVDTATVNFGTLTPGTPLCPTTPSIATVNTNNIYGYSLSVHDGSATNSALVKGGTVYIPDFSGTIAAPSSWTDGTSYGVGLSIFDADTTHAAKWCTGGILNCTTVCDTDNLYAGIPATAGEVHNVSGYDEDGDTTSFSWKLDAESTQETGSYSGDVTFTAAPNVS